MIINNNLKIRGISINNENTRSSNYMINKRDQLDSRNDNKNVSISISTQGYNKQIESLMKQKELVSERMTNYMTNALEKGVDPEIMKEQKDSFEEQIKELEGLISQLEMDNQKKHLSLNKDDDENKEKIYEKPLNQDDDIEKELLISSGIKLQELQNVSRIKTNLESEARVVKSEIKIDKGRGVNTESKEARLNKLNKGIDNIYKSIDQMKDKFSYKEVKVEDNNELKEEGEETVVNKETIENI